MADSDKLWFELGVRDDVSKVLEELMKKSDKLAISMSDISDVTLKNFYKNANDIAQVFDKIHVTQRRIHDTLTTSTGKGEKQRLQTISSELDKLEKKYKKMWETPDSMSEKGFADVQKNRDAIEVMIRSTLRYVDELDAQERAEAKHAANESKRIDDLKQKYYELQRYRKNLTDAIVNAAPGADLSNAGNLVNAISSRMSAVKRAERNGTGLPASTTGADYDEFLRKIKAELSGLTSATDSYNRALETNHRLYSSINKLKADAISQQNIANIRKQTAEYNALGQKIQEIENLKMRVDHEGMLLESGRSTTVTWTQEKVVAELDAINRRYNETLAKNRQAETDAANAKNRNTESARKAAQAIQMLANVNQSLVSSYTRIAEAGRSANNITIQFQQQLANYAGLYGLERILKSIITIGGQFEVQHKALQNILGDMQEANVLFGQLQELAVESPKTFQELTAYAKQLSAYQIPANELFDTTKRLADMSSGLGVDMSRLILAYGQVRSAAVLRGQELRQFTEAGIPLVQALADKFTQMNGKLTTTADVFALISKRAVPFEMVKEILWDMTNQGGQFYNMQAELADTLYGKWQKLQDQWQITLGHIADGTSITGAALKWLLELTVSLASAFDTLTPAVGFYGLGKLAQHMQKSAENRNGTTAIKNMELAKLKEANRLERERVMYGRQLTAQEAMLVQTKNQLLSREYALLAQSGELSAKKTQQLIADGKINRYTMMRLALEQGITKEKIRQMSATQLQNAIGLFPNKTNASMMSKFGSGLMSFFGGPWGIALTAIGGVVSAISYLNQKEEELTQKGDAMMSHAQQGANNLSKTLTSMDADGTMEKKIEVLEEALIQLGRSGEAIVAQSREHMDDINERWTILKRGAEEYQKVLETMGTPEGKALFEKGIDDSDIEDYLKNYDDAVNEKFKKHSLIERYSEVFKKAIANITEKNKELADAISGKNLFEQIDIVGQKKLYDELFVNRKNEYGVLSSSAISAMNAYFNSVEKVKHKWDEISSESIPKMEEELRALARRTLNIEDFNKLSPEQKQSLESLTREYVKAIQNGSKEAKDKLAQELASQVFHIKIVGDLTVDTTKMGTFANYIWGRFGSGGVLGDKGNIRIGNSVFSKAQVANVFKDIDTYDKESSQEILKLQTTRDKLKKLVGTADQVKDLDKQINDKLAERRAIGLDDHQKKGGSGGGAKKDAELEIIKNRVDLYKKFYTELENYTDLYGKAGAINKLRKDGEFSTVFGWENVSDLTNYKKTIGELTAELKNNSEARDKFLNSSKADIQARQRKEETEAIKEYISELQRMMNVMSENYQTYKKWVDLTGDAELAAKVAGVTQNTSMSDWLTDQMNNALKKTNFALSAQDVFGLSETDAKKLGKDSEIFKIWEWWQDNQKKIRKEQWDLYEEAYKGAKNYDDKIADVNRKLEKELAAINELARSEKERRKLTENAQQNAADQISEYEWEKFKKNSDWGRVFGDLDNMSLTTIKNMVDAMKKFQKETRLSEKETRAWQRAMKDLTDKKMTLDPVNSLTEAIKKYNAAVTKRKEAQARKEEADKNVASIQGEVVTNAYAAESKQKRLKEATDKQIEANKELTESEDDVKESFNEIKKAAMAVANSFKSIGGNISSLGSSIGGEIGNILGGFGTMFTQLGNGISAIGNLDLDAKGFTGVFNKISSVLTVVNSMVDLNKALSDILPSTESIYQKRAEEQKQINQLREAIDAYRVAVARARAEESGWIGDDPLRKLQDAYDIHGEIATEYYNKLYEAQEAYVESAAGINSALIPIVAAITAIAAVAAGIFTAGTGTVALGALGSAAIGALSAGTVAVTGITAAAIGTAIAAGVGAAVGQAIQSGIEAITYKNGQVDARSNMKVQTQHRTFFRGEKTQNLEEWTKENLGVDLFDKSGLIDLKAAQAVLDSGITLVGETKETLEKLMELREQYDEWEKSVKDYISNGFGGLTDDMVNAIWDWLSDGENALDSFKDYASNTFKQIAQDAVKTFLKTAVLDGFEKQLEDLYKAYSMKDSKTGKRIIDEQQLMLGVASIAGDMATAFEQILPLAEQLGQTITDAFSYQGYDIVGDGSGNSSSSNSIKNISENTADLLAAYMNAIRADVSVNRAMIAQYYPLFLNAMSQNNVIANAQLEQMRFIAQNTSRNVQFVEDIYNLLHGIAPDGTKIHIA